jgi:putative ABC transport system permease protein
VSSFHAVFVAVAAVFGTLHAPAAAAPLPDVVLADRTAAALGASVGDTLEIAADAAMRGAQRFVVGGVARPAADPFEVGAGKRHLTLHLPDLEALVDARDRVDRFAVRLRDRAQAERVAAGIQAMGIGIAAYTSEEVAARNSSTFAVISRFHRAIGFVSMLAGLVFLAAIMVLKVEAMRRELAVLRLIGISRSTVLRCVLLIAALVALLGSVAGIGLAHLAVGIINPASQARYDTDLVFARITPGIVLLAVGLSIPMGLAAGWFVARRIVHANPLDAMGR